MERADHELARLAQKAAGRDEYAFARVYDLTSPAVFGFAGRILRDRAAAEDVTIEIAALPARTLILDGEIAVFDAALRSRFEWLRERPKDETATQPMLIAFDCVYARRKDLRDRPLRMRRQVLEEEIAGHRLVLPRDAWPTTGSRPARRYSRGATRVWSASIRSRATAAVGRWPG